MTTNSKPRVFSGIQPSGHFSIGNYLGAIRNWVAKQDEKINFYCIVDLHALTVPQDPAALAQSTRESFALLIAAGLDPAKCTLFVQSHVAAHAEGCWLLNCITPLGWLHRMTQYKDKSAKQEQILTGLLDYPVLMAGDIIFYDADEVPVGDDQRQHVELTRDIVARFNHLYGQEFFVEPKAVIPEFGARVMGLDDPTAKMSKSSDVRGHAVKMLDEPKEILRSFKRAKTDSGNEIRFSDDPEKAGVNNLLGIYKAITDKSKEAVEADFVDARGYGDLKVRVAELTIETLTPIRERYGELMSDPAELDRLMARGAEQASAVSTPKVEQMKEIMGLIVPENRNRKRLIIPPKKGELLA